MLVREFPDAEITFLVNYGESPASRRAGNDALEIILRALGL